VDEILPAEVRKPDPLFSSPVATLHKEEAGDHTAVLADNLRKLPCEALVVQIGYYNKVVAAGAPAGSDILRAQPLLFVLSVFGHS
jgi:hypothetical protein